MVVEYQTPKEANNTYGKISMRVKPNQSRATDDKEVTKMIMNNRPNIEDVYKKHSYEELKDSLNKWLNPEEDEDEPSIPIADSVKKPIEVEEDINDLLFNDDPPKAKAVTTVKAST